MTGSVSRLRTGYAITLEKTPGVREGLLPDTRCNRRVMTEVNGCRVTPISGRRPPSSGGYHLVGACSFASSAYLHHPKAGKRLTAHGKPKEDQTGKGRKQVP